MKQMVQQSHSSVTSLLIYCRISQVTQSCHKTENFLSTQNTFCYKNLLSTLKKKKPFLFTFLQIDTQNFTKIFGCNSTSSHYVSHLIFNLSKSEKKSELLHCSGKKPDYKYEVIDKKCIHGKNQKARLCMHSRYDRRKSISTWYRFYFCFTWNTLTLSE